MRSTRKALLILVTIAVLVSVSVYATVAFFTDETSVTNTFTVGRVNITLDEAKVDTDGRLVTDYKNRTLSNTYHLLPGRTYIKDPTLTVSRTSDSTYVRLMVTITCADELTAAYSRHSLGSFTPNKLLGGFNDGWTLHATYSDTANNSLIFEYRYKSSVTPNGSDVVLPALFESFTVPGEFDGADLASIAGMEIVVVGHAIQLAGFENNEELAWQSFNNQLGSSSLPTVTPASPTPVPVGPTPEPVNPNPDGSGNPPVEPAGPSID